LRLDKNAESGGAPGTSPHRACHAVKQAGSILSGLGKGPLSAPVVSGK